MQQLHYTLRCTICTNKRLSLSLPVFLFFSFCVQLSLSLSLPVCFSLFIFLFVFFIFFTSSFRVSSSSLCRAIHVVSFHTGWAVHPTWNILQIVSYLLPIPYCATRVIRFAKKKTLASQHASKATVSLPTHIATCLLCASLPQ